MGDRCFLYYITDRSQFSGDESSRRRALLAKIAEAARAGVDFIQLRERDLGARALETLAREVVATVRESSSSTHLLINSRTDVALAVGADGVHLRGDDVGAHEVRVLLQSLHGIKPSSLFVRSGTTEVMPFPKPARVESSPPTRESQARPEIAVVPGDSSPPHGHFFVAVSCHTAGDVLRAESEGADFAVFAPVFEKRDVVGTDPKGCLALREVRAAKIPLLALGGVTTQNAAECLEAGAAGIAGIRLFQENKIEEVVRVLRGN